MLLLFVGAERQQRCRDDADALRVERVDRCAAAKAPHGARTAPGCWRCGRRTRAGVRQQPAVVELRRCQRRDHSGTCDVERERSAATSASAGRCSSRKALNSARKASTSSSNRSCTGPTYQVLNICVAMRHDQWVLDCEKILITGATGKIAFPTLARSLSATRYGGGAPGKPGRPPTRGAGIRPVRAGSPTGTSPSLPDDFTYVFHASVDPGTGDWPRCVQTNAHTPATFLPLL